MSQDALNDSTPLAETPRRTILQAAAWTVPVIGIAAATPGASASPSCTGTITFSPSPLIMNSNSVVPPTPATYLTPVTITLTGGDDSAVVDVVLTGPAYSFIGGGTTRQVTLVDGQAVVEAFTAPSNVTSNGAGTISATIANQTPACTATTANMTRQAQTLAYTSSFGVGFYPNQGTTPPGGTGTPGALQFDTQASTHNLRVNGTVPGDVVSNIYTEIAISTGWGVITNWSALDGSNTSWSTPVYVRTEGGRDIYRTSYSGMVTATGSSTDLPIGFYFRQTGTYVAGQTAVTTRFATVNGVLLQYRGPVANINNTNVALADAPTP